MEELNLALSVSIILALVKVAVGMEPADVDGALGYGRKFDAATVEELDSQYMYWNGIEDGIECCHQCKKKYKEYEKYPNYINTHPDQVMASFTQLYSPKGFCSCLKQKSAATRPVTTAYGGFSDFCGKQLAQVDGGVGDGRIFTSKSVNQLNAMSDFVKIHDKDTCCQICKTKYPQTEMFDYYRWRKICMCYTTIPGKSPVTKLDVSFADVCGSNVDLAYSTINKENCYDLDIDYPGNDVNPVTNTMGTYLYHIKSSAESCQYLCSITDGCKYFTWSTGHNLPYNNGDNGRCYLKSSKSSKSSEKGAISGPKNCS